MSPLSYTHCFAHFAVRHFCFQLSQEEAFGKEGVLSMHSISLIDSNTKENTFCMLEFDWSLFGQTKFYFNNNKQEFITTSIFEEYCHILPPQFPLFSSVLPS